VQRRDDRLVVLVLEVRELLGEAGGIAEVGRRIAGEPRLE
jgi:hypothetical protein